MERFTENAETSASKFEYNIKQGNDHFINEHYALAVKSYTYTLEITEITEPESIIMFYLKKAKCYLQLQWFTNSLCDAKTILTRDPQHTKAELFKSKTLIALKKYTEAVDTLIELKKAAKKCNKMIATALQHAKKLVIESRNENYNITDILDKLPLEREDGGSCLNCYLNHANYISDIIKLQDTGLKARVGLPTKKSRWIH